MHAQLAQLTDLVKLTDLTAILPGKPHISTIRRYVAEGVRGHRLQTVRVGGRRFVSPEAINEFIKATNDVELPAAKDLS